MSSPADSDTDSDSNPDDSFDFFNEIGGNGFAFEPEYSANEVEERLRAHDEVSSDDDANLQCCYQGDLA